MNKMNLLNLFIPVRLAPLLSRLLNFKKVKNEVNGEIHYQVPESWIVEVLHLLGAEYSMKMKQSGPENEKNEFLSMPGHYVIKNQLLSLGFPEESLELIETAGYNVIKAVMEYRKLSLKDVAEKYGGKSGAANIANFLARTDEELRNTRKSTLVKIATAMDVPAQWFLIYLGIDESSHS